MKLLLAETTTRAELIAEALDLDRDVWMCCGYEASLTGNAFDALVIFRPHGRLFLQDEVDHLNQLWQTHLMPPLRPVFV